MSNKTVSKEYRKEASKVRKDRKGKRNLKRVSAWLG